MAEQDRESLKKDFEKILQEAEAAENAGNGAAGSGDDGELRTAEEAVREEAPGFQGADAHSEDDRGTETPGANAYGAEEAGNQDDTGEADDAGSEETDEADGSENPGQEDTPSGPMSWAEKKAAKKQAKQDKKADGCKEKIDQLEDKVKRQMAEFENFRKRSEREKQMMFETGAKSVVEKILPVIDNFERGLATVPAEQLSDPFVDGMNRVYKQMLTELEAIDVKPIEAVGKEFDPNLHNAVMQVESEEYESGTVAQELQKGYTYRDSVVRHSMVAVVS